MGFRKFGVGLLPPAIGLEGQIYLASEEALVALEGASSLRLIPLKLEMEVATKPSSATAKALMKRTPSRWCPGQVYRVTRSNP